MNNTRCGNPADNLLEPQNKLSEIVTESANDERPHETIDSQRKEGQSAISKMDQMLQFEQQANFQDVTMAGSDAKSLKTPHGSVADDPQAMLAEVVPVTLTNGNDSIFGMVTALASSEPSKPRHDELIVGSYPGEADEADLPTSLHSYPYDADNSELHSVDPLIISDPQKDDDPIMVHQHSQDNVQSTSSSNPPDQFHVEDISPKDSTEELMGDLSPSKSTGGEDDFYSRYRTPTVLPIANVESMERGEKEDVTSSGESTEDVVPVPENIQQKLAGSWMQCTVPGFITQLFVSDRNVWCVDNRDKIYHTLVNSVNYKWSKLKDSGMQIAVSPSESIVWRVHRRTNIAYASAPITPRSPVGSKWEQACRDVAYVCLDERIAWLIKTNGTVCVQKNISKDRPYSKTIQVDSNMHIEAIAANREVVWGLTTEKVVVFRTDISSIKPQGRLWRELTDR